MACLRLPLPVVGAVVLVLLISMPDATSAFQCSNSDTSPFAVFDCMNAVRTNPQFWSQFANCDFSHLRPVGSLAEDGRLTFAADRHARGMAAERRLHHDNLSFRVWTEAGFPRGKISENVAAGQNSALEVVMTWMCSSGHQKNLMDCEVNKVGTGVTCGNSGPYSCYFTQVFGCDSGSCSC